MAAECYALTFDEVDQPSGASIRINAEVLEKNATRNSAIYLTSSMSQVESVLHKNVNLGGVRILLTVPWMKEFLQLQSKEDVLSQYINLKTAGVWYMPVDAELKELLHYLITPQEDPRLFYQNKLLRIIEKFFNWLYNEMQSLNSSGISRQDIEAAQTVEGIITQDITALPPTIKELAKEVAMSESKLKKIFKTVFGLPPYEYFQKHRMQKARIMLLSGDHSIKDVGYTLGYSNLSNFTLAFKKEFKMLPSDLLKSIR
jgi:AraC-like DNA-binding protein